MDPELIKKKREYEERKARTKLALKQCTICGAENAKLCQGCGTTAYCSTDCQRVDWRDRGHRKACKKIRDERAAEAARAEAPTPSPSPPKEVFYGPAPRSHADEVRARIAAEHAAARVRREANPEPEPVHGARFGSRCPICLDDWDVNVSPGILFCCARTVCMSCAEKIRDMPCPLCRKPWPKSTSEALALLRHHVENEVPEAICVLAEWYKEGDDDLMQSSKKAAKLYKRAAELGDSRAMVALGCLYEHGDGVERNAKKAKQLYGMAAARGNATGQISFGTMIQYEPGGDLDEAKRWYERAAARGHRVAMNALEHLRIAPAPPTDVELRFNVGDSVICCAGDDYSSAAGKIVALWFRSPDSPPGFYAPYQVKLDNGRLIFAPMDADICICAPGGRLGIPTQSLSPYY